MTAGTRNRSALAVGADQGAMALLIGVGVVGFGPLFGGTGYLIAGLGGMILGLGLGWLGARFTLGILTLSAATVAAYLLFGAALAVPTTALGHVVPSLASLHSLLLGAVQTWKQVLTVAPPVGAIPGTLILPFLTALVCSVTASSLALRLRRPGWALLPAGAVIIVAITFGTSEAAFPLAQGLVFAVAAVCWLAWRRASHRDRQLESDTDQASEANAHRRLRARRVAAAAGVITAAVVTAVLLQSIVVPADARQILRTAVIPPVDIQNYPSPLQSYRKYVKAGVNPKNVLFSVSGLRKGTRIRLATLDSYDGTVYSVAADGGSGAGSFSAVTGGVTAAADPFLAGTAQGTPETITVTAGSLTGVWMPDIGYPTSVIFAGKRAQQLAGGLNYNATTGVAISTTGLQQGDSYTVRAIVPTTTGASARDSLANVTLPQNQSVPDAVSAFAATATSSAQTPLARLHALTTALATKGFFSHGLSGDYASLPGHGTQRLTSFLGGAQIVGDDEQYAVAMSLMANQLGIPARVVMGFYPKTYAPERSVAITGADLHAWVEVDFDKLGWIAFDPTPDQNKKPDQQMVKSQVDPRAQVLQPPPAPPVAVSAPNDPATRGGKSTKVTTSTIDTILGLLRIGGSGLGVLALLFGPVLLIAFLKARRRRRRATAAHGADRLSGGWDEIVDVAQDLGTPLTAGRTRMEGALMLAERYPTAGIMPVATIADTGVFGPLEPSAEDTAAFWTQVNMLVKEMHGSAGRFRRLKARLSIVTFTARRREATAMTQKKREKRRTQ
jgi:transglutaminase-like putative cysteine protease